MANDNPELLDGFATDEASLIEAISTELASYGWSLTNSKINGKQLNTMFNQIFGYLNFLQKKGFSFWQEDKSYIATASYIDIVRRGNKIYFAKQDSNPDPKNNPLPKAPESNPDYWRVLLDLDNPIENYALKTETMEQLATELTNIDTHKSSGSFRVSSTATGNPFSNYCAMVVYGNESNVVSQLITDMTTGKSKIRSYNTSWSAWNNVGVNASDILTALKTVDGLNSGLDTDLVRGLPADFTSLKSSSGYQKLPSGLIFQWGKATTNLGGDFTLTFPIAFPNSCLIATSNPRADNYSSSVHGISNTYVAGSTLNSNVNGGSGVTIDVFVIGY